MLIKIDDERISDLVDQFCLYNSVYDNYILDFDYEYLEGFHIIVKMYCNNKLHKIFSKRVEELDYSLHSTYLLDSMKQSIHNFITEGNRLNAIRYYKWLTNSKILEAKQFIDSLMICYR